MIQVTHFLTLLCKNISKVDYCIWMFPNLLSQLNLHELGYLYCHEEALLNNQKVGCQHSVQKSHSNLKIPKNTYVHIKIRSWQYNYHGLVLQKVYEKGYIKALHRFVHVHLISSICIWEDYPSFPKSENHFRNCRHLFINSQVHSGNSCISKDIKKTNS